MVCAKAADLRVTSGGADTEAREFFLEVWAFSGLGFRVPFKRIYRVPLKGL